LARHAEGENTPASLRHESTRFFNNLFLLPQCAPFRLTNGGEIMGHINLRKVTEKVRGSEIFLIKSINRAPRNTARTRRLPELNRSFFRSAD